MNEISKKSKQMTPREKNICELIGSYKSVYEIAQWLIKDAEEELRFLEKPESIDYVTESRIHYYSIYRPSEVPSVFIKKNRNDFNLYSEEVLYNPEYPLKKMLKLCFKLGFYLEWLVMIYLEQIKEEKLHEYGSPDFYKQIKERHEARIDKGNEAFTLLMNLSVFPWDPLRARYYANHQHGRQLYGDRPYLFHLDSVVETLRAFDDDTLLSIGYLHDVLEDTEIKASEMENYFGGYVTKCVQYLTDPEGATRAIRKEKSHEKLLLIGPLFSDALIVKSADRLSNIRMCVKDENYKKLLIYKMEHKDFRMAIFRSGLCDLLWKEIDEIMDRREW